jgi:hypothetical protein
MKKSLRLLQEILEGEATEDVKLAARDLLRKAQRNEAVRGLSSQLGRLRQDVGRNTRSLRQQTSKQVKSWLASLKEKLDNW